MTANPSPELREEAARCGCYRCASEAVTASGGGPLDPRLQRMFLCAVCGNKRCPHATDHRLACTGSNEAGQEGSAYGVPLKSSLSQGGGELERISRQMIREWVGGAAGDDVFTRHAKALEDAWEALGARHG